MSIKMISPVGKKVMDIREEDRQLYLERGYKYVDASTDLETIEMMSPAGKVVIMKKDVGDYLQREGWSLLESKPLIEDEKPEPSVEDGILANPEKSVEDEIPILPTDEAPVKEPEMVKADAETINDIPEGAEEVDAELER